MDDSEKAAREYILYLGYKDEELLFEPQPDGQAGADLVVNGRIAIEVTRLESHVAPPTDGKRRGEEGAVIPVLNSISEILASFAPPTSGYSWFVNVDCNLPAPPKRTFERETHKRLKEFLAGPQKPTKIHVLGNLVIELSLASRIGPYYFLMGNFNHQDCGGLLSDELEKNVSICIGAKAKRLSYLRKKEWESCWLALVDRISHGYWDSRDKINVPPHGWDKNTDQLARTRPFIRTGLTGPLVRHDDCS